jgi:bacillithiol biosynthesis cysteine-adding enzyme BshC
MTLEIQSTPLDGSGGLAMTAALDRGVALNSSLRPALTGHDRGLENLDLLVRGEAHCVTTGQQPGLFTGPLYTLYKAISAVVLARACSASLGRPVVPVFWVAGDDHDFAEANHFTLLSAANQLETLGLPPRESGAPSTPLYRDALGVEVEGLIARLAELLPETEFRAEALAWLSRHYRSGNDLATAFGDALAELLGPMGLVVFQPSHAAAKAAAAPWVLQALEGAAELDGRLQARARELEGAGKPVPVGIQPGNTLVMVDGTLGRDRLMLDGDGFVARRSGEKWSLPALQEVAENAPERLSANVLLRPVVEAVLFPTLAYVAGPGELAYHPQTEPVYETLGVLPQPYVPRWSARVIEARVRKTMDRYHLTPEDFMTSEGQLEARLVQDAMPVAAGDALARLRETVDEQFAALVQAAGTIDPTLEKPIEHTRNQMTGGLDHVEKRLVSRLKQQNEVLVRQLANARNAVFPNGRPQERVFNVLQYLVKYGPDFLHQAEASCESWAAALGSDG